LAVLVDRGSTQNGASLRSVVSSPSPALARGLSHEERRIWEGERDEGVVLRIQAAG